MFDNIEELKEFLLWAKAEKIQHVKVGDVEVLFSNIALIEDDVLTRAFTPAEAKKTEEKNTSKTLVDEAEAFTDDDLYYSAR